MRFVPRSVMIGFVNALGILIFAAQVLISSTSLAGLSAVRAVRCHHSDRAALTLTIPAPLIAIVVVTAIVMIGNLSVPNVGGEGAMAPGLPRITPWLVPLDLETLRIVWRPRSASPSWGCWKRCSRQNWSTN